VISDLALRTRFLKPNKGLEKNKLVMIMKKLLHIVSRLIKSTIIVAGIGAFSSCTLYSNFHTVDAGKLYRSGQMNKFSFVSNVKKYHIKSVVNLRHSDKYMVKLEKKWCKDLQLDHYNIPMSRGINKDRILEVLELLKKAEKPILVHCQAGKDRTGLISAIYVIDFKKQPDKALDQLTLKYLYIRTPGRSYPKIINQYFSETSNGAEKSFEEWLKEDYRQMIK
jgi:protein tyrosine/serine phosphatase